METNLTNSHIIIFNHFNIIKNNFYLFIVIKKKPTEKYIFQFNMRIRVFQQYHHYQR